MSTQLKNIMKIQTVQYYNSIINDCNKLIIIPLKASS